MAATANPSNQEVYQFERPGEHVIRHGEAAPIREPKALGYTGRLDTPRQFLEQKKAAAAYPFILSNGGLITDQNPRYRPEDATLVIDAANAKLTLHLNDWATPGDTITGELKPDPILAKFFINTEGKRWSPNELWLFLKTMGYFFADEEAHKAFLTNLRGFTSKVSTAVESRHDNAGNRKAVFERVVEENSLSNNPFFTLRIPLYQGYAPQEFRVEVGFDPTDAGVSIFLVSDDLYKLLLVERAELLEVEEKYFREWGCSVLTKS